MNDDAAVAPKSKSQRKRELRELQGLGERLLGLSPRELAGMPVSERLREALGEARGYRRGALRRQLQYIGRLMVGEDEAAIRLALETLGRPRRRAVEDEHELERWRERLIEGDEALLDELCARFAVADRRHLRRLARNALRQRHEGQASKSALLLLRYLGDLRAGEEGGHG